MGVLGLWRLLDPAGKPTAVETLEGKVLAVDVSIWIHQVLQGYKDGRGDSVQNAHLLGLFNRICKLLFFKIKPVFVFDGGVPILKRNTIATRRKLKSIAGNKARNLQQQLMSNLIKHLVVNNALDRRTQEEQNSSIEDASETAATPNKTNDSHTSIEQPSTSNCQQNHYDFVDDSDYDSSEESSSPKQSKWFGNIHNVNIDTEEFQSLPADVKYDILTDLKDTRKQNSWGRIHEMPPVLNEFSDFQMKRLLKRRHVQKSLETVEKEIGGSKNLTLEELEKLLTEQGIETSDHDNRGIRVASDSASRVMFANDKNVAQEKWDKITANLRIDDVEPSTSNESTSVQQFFSSHVEFKETSSSEDMHAFDKDDDWDSDVDQVLKPIPENSVPKSDTMEKVTKYMLEHTSLTEEQVFNFVTQKRKRKHKLNKKQNVSLKSHKKDKLKRNSKDAKSFTLDDKSEKIQQEFAVAEEGIFSETTHVCDSSSDSDEFVTVESKTTTENNTYSDSNSVQISNDLLVNKTILSMEKSETVNKDFTISKVQEISSESSDSDSDFITVDNLIPETSFTQKNEAKISFDVIIKPDINLKNDLFADIFATEETKKANFLLETMDKDTVTSAFFQTENELNCKNSDLTPNKSWDTENTEEEQNKAEDELKNDLKNESRDASSGIGFSQESASESNITSTISSQFSDEASTSVALPLSQLTETDIVSMRNELEDERRELNEQIGKFERQTVNVTEQMCTDAQELLRLFGIPYIVAPMEAEAQCAYLEQINLTDGTITDDSDIWLFGAKCVYKNFFNNNKTVLQFRSCDIHHHFKLARQQLIQLALLVGSDYTSGLRGVGPVTAMEILAAFPSEGENVLQGLVNFADWIKSGKTAEHDRNSLRNKLKNLQIAEGFPSQSVVQAYLSPTVDESEEKFTWRKPNLNLLMDYVKQKFGWDKLRFEEKMNPIMKKLAEGKRQKGIDSYFPLQVARANIKESLSKRLQLAVRKMDSEKVEESDTKRTTKRKKAKANDNSAEAIDEADSLLLVKELQDQVLPEDISQIEAGTSKSKGSRIITQKSQSANDKKSEEFIPQRESSRVKAAKNKIHAIEVFNKSKKKSGRTKKKVRRTGKILKNAELSESSSSSS